MLFGWVRSSARDRADGSAECSSEQDSNQEARRGTLEGRRKERATEPGSSELARGGPLRMVPKGSEESGRGAEDVFGHLTQLKRRPTTSGASLGSRSRKRGGVLRITEAARRRRSERAPIGLSKPLVMSWNQGSSELPAFVSAVQEPELDSEQRESAQTLRANQGQERM